MTMRHPLPHVLALLLGAVAALLVACGGGTKGGIPAASAGELKSQIADVQHAVDDGRCDDVSGQLRQVDDSIDALPSTVDQRLRQSLRDASDRLHTSALAECKAQTETTQTQTVPTETQTQAPPTETQTVPTVTQTVPVPPTTTPAPTTTRPVPPPTTTSPPVPPAEPPAPPPGTPGGGASPEVPR
jgi:outer membrane biosynthesis protein TonB